MVLKQGQNNRDYLLRRRSGFGAIHRSEISALF
jgi:hypothetical protein